MEEENKVEEIKTEGDTVAQQQPVPVVEEHAVEPEPVTSEPVTVAPPELPKIEEEHVEPEKPKKEKSNEFVIVLLILAIGFFPAWFFWMGGDVLLGFKEEEPKQAEKKEDKKEEKQEEKKEESKIVTLKEEDIKDYEPIINNVLYIRLDKDAVTANSLTNQEILFFGITGTYNWTDKKTVSRTEIENNIVKKLGNIEYKDEDYICDMDKRVLLHYNADKGEYTVDETHGHGSRVLRTYKYLQSAEKDETKGIITIKYKILFGSFDDMIGPGLLLYANEKDALNGENKIFSDTLENIGVTKEEKAKEVYEEHKDEIPTLTIIFEKDASGNYVFKSLA